MVVTGTIRFSYAQRILMIPVELQPLLAHSSLLEHAIYRPARCREGSGYPTIIHSSTISFVSTKKSFLKKEAFLV